VNLPSVLIVEDDRELRSLLERALAEAGLHTRACATAGEVMEETRQHPPDAMVLDVGLPDADGRDLCQALRARGAQFPILFLTAHGGVTDRLAGFSAGGDDYLGKPFAVAELIARLWALLRRNSPMEPSMAGSLSLDPVAHRASVAGHELSLTPTEFRLLAALGARPGDALKRRHLVGVAWPDGAIVHDNTLDVYVARLRRKLRGTPGAPEIVTVHGVGYRLVDATL